VVNPGIEGMETSAQFVQIAPPNDIVVTILFEVRIGTQRNAMSLCIPYLVLKPITAKLSAQKWFAGSNRRNSPVSRRSLTYQVNQSKVQCAVRLGGARLGIRQFLSLKPGDILKLDQETDQDMTLTVSNIAKFKGKPALQGKKMIFAVTDRIEE